MKKNFTKILSLCLVVVFFGSVLAGCAPKKDATATPTPTVKTPVEITLWEQEEPNNDGIYDKAFADFMVKNPEIKITRVHYNTDDLRNQFQTTAAAGEGPDIVFGPDDNIGVFNAMKIIQPMANFVDPATLALLDEKAIEDCKIGGELYGLPDRQGNNIMLVYNKKMIQTPPETMEELITVAKKFTNEKKGEYGLVFQAYEPFFEIWIPNALGGKVFDDKYQPTIDTAPFVAMYQFIYDIFNVSKIIPKDCNYDIASNLFKEGKAPMIINGPWSWGEYEKAGIEVGLAQLPKQSNGVYGAAFTSTKAYFVSKNLKAEKTEAVKKVMGLFASKDFQMEFAKASGWMPSNKEGMADPYVQNDPKFKAALEGMKSGIPMPVVPEMRAIWDSMKLTVPDVMNGKMKPEAAAKKAQEEAIKNIANMNK